MSEVNNTQPFLYDAGEQRADLRSALVGFVVGLGVWVLDLGIQRYFIEPIFCHNADSFGVCSQGGTVAWIIAIVLGMAAALFTLVRFNVFRPLLVILASVISLWGVANWIGPLPWWQAMLWHGALFALAFGLFSLIARIERFGIAFVLTIVLILAFRLVVVNA
jgi:hypothetical protein